MTRLMFVAMLSLVPAFGQLNLSVIADGTEQAVGMSYNLGAIAAGDSADVVLRLKNAGNAIASVSTLTVGGSGFTLAEAPALPTRLAPDAWFDFRVRFSPGTPGAFSAVLQAEHTFVYLLATASPAMSVSVMDGASVRRLDTVSALDFGGVERGTQLRRRLLLENQTAKPLTAQLAVIGASFRLASDAPPAIALDPQQSAWFEIVYEPRQSGSQQGELRLDQRRFLLRGSVLEPPLPKPLLTIDWGGEQPRSGLQASVGVRFDPPPRTSGAGTLRIEFRPAPGLKDDSAIQLLAFGARESKFSVIETEPAAQFGPASTIWFQTGTTAGTLLFTAQVGDFAETYSVEIPPAMVKLDTARMTRTASSIDVEISGFDNTRSLSQAAFTFFRRDGTPAGTIRQDVSADFRTYFDASDAGGVFRMRASFPVNAAADIESVEIEMVNSQGSSKTAAK